MSSNTKLNTVKKANIEVYYVRLGNGDWADISLDVSDGYERFGRKEIGAGRLSISSSHGNWAHYWGSCGSPFKQFLTELDKYYVASKFGMHRYFDAGGTIQRMKREILDTRIRGDITAIDARYMYDAVDDSDPLTPESLYSVIYHNDLLSDFFVDFDVNTIIDPQFNHFWDTVWVHFVSYLQLEICKG